MESLMKQKARNEYQRNRRQKIKESKKNLEIINECATNDDQQRLLRHPDIKCSHHVFDYLELGQLFAGEMAQKLHENKQSYVTTALVAGVCNKMSRGQVGRMLKINGKQVDNIFYREDGTLPQVLAQSRRRQKNSNVSRASEEERKLTRDWLRSKCKIMSNKSQLQCKLSRKELYHEYIIDGFPTICLSLLKLKKFQKKRDDYRVDDGDPSRSHGLPQALHLVQKWADSGLHNPRPLGIWARDRRTFWKIIKEREKGKNGKQLLTLNFSEKLHICFSCTTYRPLVHEYRALTELLLKAKTPHDKKAIKERRDKVIKKLTSLMDHMMKFQVQRPELKALEKKLDLIPKLIALLSALKTAQMSNIDFNEDTLEKIPILKDKDLQSHLINDKIETLSQLEANVEYLQGVAIIYEDFCSRYQCDGCKMHNLILVLYHYDKKLKKARYVYYDTFSIGSLPANARADDYKTRGKQDRYMYRDVWLLHLWAGLFAQFHTLIKSGDNGASLKCYDILYFASMIWKHFNIRVLWHTLCPHHAVNRCDPHGGLDKQFFTEEERKRGGPLGTAKAHKDALNRRAFQNTAPANEVSVTWGPDSWMPLEICTQQELKKGKKDRNPKNNQNKNYDIYGIQSLCVAFPEVPNIHELVDHPTTSVQVLGLAMGATTQGGDVYFIDLRTTKGGNSNQKPISLCEACTDVFGRNVAIEEHDQTRHYLCPITNIYTLENDTSRLCKFCNRTVKDSHRKGTKKSCPSTQIYEKRLKMKKKDKLLPIHKSFNTLTMYGTFQRLRIAYKRLPPLSDQELEEGIIKYKEVMEEFINVPENDNEKNRALKAGDVVVWKRRIEREDALPWVIGQCRSIDAKAKTCIMQLFQPSLPKPRKKSPAPGAEKKSFQRMKNYPYWDWQFRSIEKKITLPLKTQFYHISLSRNKLSTKDILEIARSGQYGWDIDSLQETPKPKENFEEIGDEIDDSDDDKPLSEIRALPVDDLEDIEEGSDREWDAYLDAHSEPEPDIEYYANVP